MEKDSRSLYEFLPGKLYYTSLSSKPTKSNTTHYFSTDTELVYWNFFLDFGPLNLGHLMRFCKLLNSKLDDPKLQDKTIVYFSGSHAHKRANSAFLICGWAILYLNKTPEEAYAPFRNIYPPFPPWHDATPTVCHFNLTVLDTLRGLYKAHKLKYFDLDNFDLSEYEHYEQVENGDLNWCMDGKFLAFAGPHASKEAMEGYFALAPEDYIPYFKKKNVTLVIRFNKKYYDARRFTTQGIDHSELYFVDGTNPPEHILSRFLQLCEETPGAVAVHCKAGLGRTGTCIGCYLMKHHRLTAEEAIGWLRIVRPGSVIGPQQQFMKDMQARLWRDGDLMRQRLGISIPTDYDDIPSIMTPITVAESKRSNSNGGGDLDSTNRLMSNLSLSNSDKKSSSNSSGISSAKPNLTNRLSASGRSTLGSSSTNSPDDDGEVTQGDMLRQRRTYGHHLTPAEAKSQSNNSSSSSSSSSLSLSQSKGTSSTSNTSAKSSSSSNSSSTTNSSSLNPSRPTTRSQISKLLGK